MVESLNSLGYAQTRLLHACLQAREQSLLGENRALETQKNEVVQRLTAEREARSSEKAAGVAAADALQVCFNTCMTKCTSVCCLWQFSIVFQMCMPTFGAVMRLYGD